MACWPVIDSHCHLDFPVFDSTRSQIIDNALTVGVSHIVIPAVVAQYFKRVIDTASAYPQISFALGLHPCFMREHQPEDLQTLADYVETHPACAIGEIGLDFYIADYDAVSQISLLKAQLKIAKAHHLPVLLHVRKAHDIMLKTLREMKFEQGGIVHAFNGSRQQAEQFINMGFKLGFGGAITYPGANKLRKLVATLPLDSIVLETDAPDMPLSGRQGEYNQPAYVAEVLQEIAGLRVESAECIAAATTASVEGVLSLGECNEF